MPTCPAALSALLDASTPSARDDAWEAFVATFSRVILHGRAVGADGVTRGIVWESPTSYTVLDGIAYAINDGATIVVGDRNGAPAYWHRDATSGAWVGTGVELPTAGGSSCAARARDVNDAGIVVGTSCGPNGKRQATTWQLDLSGPVPVVVTGPTLLGGLGVTGSGAETSGAAAVTSAPPYVAAGGAASNGGLLLVSWQLP